MTILAGANKLWLLLVVQKYESERQWLTVCW